MSELRLENLQKVHADALRSGYMDDVIAFARGRALERLRAFDLAAASYEIAAGIEGALWTLRLEYSRADTIRNLVQAEPEGFALALGLALSVVIWRRRRAAAGAYRRHCPTDT